MRPHARQTPFPIAGRSSAVGGVRDHPSHRLGFLPRRVRGQQHTRRPATLRVGGRRGKRAHRSGGRVHGRWRAKSGRPVPGVSEISGTQAPSRSGQGFPIRTRCAIITARAPGGPSGGLQRQERRDESSRVAGSRVSRSPSKRSTWRNPSGTRCWCGWPPPACATAISTSSRDSIPLTSPASSGTSRRAWWRRSATRSATSARGTTSSPVSPCSAATAKPA